MRKLTIESLTPEQLGLMSVMRQEYIDVLTKDFDDDDIIRKVRWIYEFHRFPKPDVHILDHPQQFKSENVKSLHVVGPHKYGKLHDGVINEYLYEMWERIKESVDEPVLDLAKREMLQKINGPYSDRATLERIVRRTVLNDFQDIDMGKDHHVPMLSIYDYFLRIGAVKDTSKDKVVEKFLEYIKSGITYRLYGQNHAYIIRNNNGPQFRDELGRLHNDKGYAVAWRIDEKGRIESGLNFVKGVYFSPELFDKIFRKP